MLLENKVAIITGAGRGIGRAIALKFFSEGAITIINDIDEENATAVGEKLIDSGREAFVFTGDVSNENDVKSMVYETIKKFGKIDILVNNAGLSLRKEGRRPNLTEISLEEWNKVIAVNLTSVFLCCRAALPYMIERKFGRIINISSVAALTGGMRALYVPSKEGSRMLTFNHLAGAHYAASKGGVRMLTFNLASEVARYGITVNNIAPGRIQTRMAGLASDEINEEILKQIPLGRFGMPEEVGEVAAFLASDKSNYITGTTFNVSGGYVTS